MRDDWERRAREDAAYYVAFGGRKQKPEEFFASAGDALRAIRSELYRLAPRTSALEIGCGPGRLMRPLSAEFGAVSGVDVSPTMVALARENLAATAGARVELSNGSDLRQFASESIDFCYSYAVFQHIPERAIVLSYMREACRVLKPGGVFRFQVNGLPRAGAARPGTHRRLVGPLRRARGFGRSRRPSRYLERRQLLGRRDSRFRRGARACNC